MNNTYEEMQEVIARKRAILAMLESEGWKIFSGVAREQIRLREHERKNQRAEGLDAMIAKEGEDRERMGMETFLTLPLALCEGLEQDQQDLLFQYESEKADKSDSDNPEQFEEEAP